MLHSNLIIIGFGISGISLAKEASKRNINFKILEKNRSFGGVWFNTNKYTCLQTHRNYYEFKEEECMDESYGDYPKRDSILNYLSKIVEKYKLLEDVIFNYEVKNIVYDNLNKLWIIDNKYSCDFIGICSGINSKQNLDIKQNEIKQFNGIINHYNDLKDINKKDFINQNILIIGNGASACDILNILDDINCRITCVYRTNRYYIGKYVLGISTSIILSRIILLFFKYIPLKLYRCLIKLVNNLVFFNYLDIPKEKMNSKNLVASNIISKKINNGTLVYLKDKIKYCNNKNVILNDNILLNIDRIILATGYKEDYGFFSREVNVKNNKYLQIFDINYQNCAFIGFSPSYNWPKISEKQSKIFLDLITGDFKINEKDVDKYYKNHTKNQKLNNMEFNDLTYELFNY